MKYYKAIQCNNLTHDEAMKLGKFITRPEWDGIHFINKSGKNTILLKTGEIMVTDNIMNKEDNDWMTVTVTSEAMTIINKYKLL